MKSNVCNIVFGGIGGQGILKASEICATAALCEGHHVKKSEVHGMAQRGGSVESHVRFGDAVYSPLVGAGGADYLVCFHEDEHERLRRFLRREGVDLTVYLKQAADALRDRRQLNTFLVGVLSAHLEISQGSWEKALEAVFESRIREENYRVFVAGRSLKHDME